MNRSLTLPLFATLPFLVAGACGSAAKDGDPTGEDPSHPGEAALYLEIGPDVPPSIAARIKTLLTQATSQSVLLQDLPDAPAAGSKLIAIGSTTTSAQHISQAELSALGSEGFVLRSVDIGGVPALVANGNAQSPKAYGIGDIGDGYAAYALLEELGFAFLHPLEPHTPGDLPATWPTVDRSESPRWPVRGIHIHTMHPLELTNLLNGWGQNPADEAGFRAMLPEWESTAEWLIANKQNRVQWVLLWAESWAEFADSPERIARLADLVDIAHGYGLGVGVDVPIALQQQHAFRLLREQGELADELAQIRSRIDYVMQAGFDFLATENGTSEFTHADADRTLAWMNEFAVYLDEAYGAEGSIKVHASQGQTLEGFADPDTGEPLNVNFLPHYADARLGILPHTVQHYSLDDPAPTYGNQSFDFMRDYIRQQAGSRQTIWYPETAYWVSFDIDVPLFLPVYAHRRLHDLRLLAADEDAGLMGRDSKAGSRMDGQMIFSSGWEWGYWLNDVVSARAAWNPYMELSEPAAFKWLLGQSLALMGPASAGLVDLVAEVAEMQKAVLIEGKVGGVSPSEIHMRTGQAYLQGFDAWDDVADLASGVPLVPEGFLATQPQKLGLVSMRNPLHGGPGYSAEVEPLLAEMVNGFAAQVTQMEALAGNVDSGGRGLYDELLDSLRITHLRAQQLHGLYDYVDGYNPIGADTPGRQERLDTAIAAKASAAAIVVRREANYRVAPERIAGWLAGPTAYEFRYLWSVRTLFYWARDEAKAVDIPLGPCFMNIVNPANVGLGEGNIATTTEGAQDFLGNIGVTAIADCLGAPESEPLAPVSP